MVELIGGLESSRIRRNLERLRQEVAAAAADPSSHRSGRSGVEVLAATKYVATAELPVLAQAGVRVVGENRAQDLQEKFAAHGELFEWDFIGQLQSRRVRLIVPYTRLIHSVASQSALEELRRHAERARPGLRILLEVNVAGEPDKAGIAPEKLGRYLDQAPLPVAGLMTMPPLARDPQDSRRWFAALRELADRHGLEHLSMGTSQDYVVAVQEGATIVRIGTRLYD
ncbi:MAG: YggS family pyridoxal phosphate-dependent enzyme [Solirubrobacteraceae bacterium]